MSIIDGQTSFGGWTIHVQAAIVSDPFGYDAPDARYNFPGVTYDDGSAERTWRTLDCQIEKVATNMGGRAEQIPGVRANLGRLTAALIDPRRELDPAASPFRILTKPGVGVRLVAVSPTGVMVPLWSGRAETWSHDLLDGRGELVASDLVAAIAGVDVADWHRKTENSKERLLGVLGQVPMPMSLLFEGVASQLSYATFSGSAWGAAVNTAEAEQSLVWVDALGRLRRADVTGLNRPPVLAMDCDDVTLQPSIVYTALTSLSDDDSLTNMVIADRLNLTEAERERPPRQYAHTESVRIHGPHSLTQTTLPLLDDLTLETWGNRILDLRATPTAAATGMKVTIADGMRWTPRTVPAVVALDVGSTLDIRLTSRGQAERWVGIVAGLQHTITSAIWEVGIELVDGPRVAQNWGYDDPKSIYNVSVYSRPPTIGPATPARIAAIIARIAEEALV